MATRQPRLRGLLAIRDRLRANWLARNVAVAVLGCALLIPLALTPAYRLVEGRTFDLLSILAPVRPETPGAVIVAIDEPSFNALNQRWPWPRDLHARLVESLRRAGARAIGLDMLFAEPSTPEADRALVRAMGGDVVLAATEEVVAMDQGVQVSRIGPLPELLAAGASEGVTSVELDGDAVLRRMPPAGEAFAERLLAVAGAPAPVAPAGSRIQYFGPARSYPTVSYYQALEPEKYLPPGRLKGQIVLVGLSLSNPPKADAGGADAFVTPFTLTQQTLTAGVEVHATILDNLRQGLSLRVPPFPVLGLITLAAALAAAALSGVRTSWRTGVAALAMFAVVSVGSWLMLRTGRVWVTPFLPLAAAGFVFAGCFTLDYAVERRLRAAVSDAFSRYVAPELVQELARNPAALKLGGERRTLTILFCDVRGFTSLSESLRDEPERLSSIINRLLDALSAEVLEQRGTIDKYMGDCIMAFWNAPLPDERHAEHAVLAAQGMVKAVARVNAELAGELGDRAPSLSVGVGVNTGDCVVGNLGSRWRYDYSVLGDAVNLASRLEGTTKELGVQIVLGETTADAVTGRIPLRPLGSITVRGRHVATQVYTVEDSRTGVAG